MFGLTIAEIITLVPVIIRALTGVADLIRVLKEHGQLSHFAATQTAVASVAASAERHRDYAFQQNTIDKQSSDHT